MDIRVLFLEGDSGVQETKQEFTKLVPFVIAELIQRLLKIYMGSMMRPNWSKLVSLVLKILTLQLILFLCVFSVLLRIIHSF